MTEFYARIHPASSYYADQDTGEPFRVTLKPEPTDGFYWLGGPGGQYRHSDLQLFVKCGDELERCRMYAANGERSQIVRIMLADILAQAERGELCPEHLERWVTQQRKRLTAILTAARTNWVEEVNGI